MQSIHDLFIKRPWMPLFYQLLPVLMLPPEPAPLMRDASSRLPTFRCLDCFAWPKFQLMPTTAFESILYYVFDGIRILQIVGRIETQRPVI